ncbi:hypothetical protein IE81DRAFT_366164 [Ceraceosorus guamensis]|uniref:Ras-GAP domain-containing protein n=1 Tax=Ceraceosorus guamensis TaxID=1522189 RepID=A0A316W0D1_9BASI|nr:hypothetical protein IE81DRAFT_366164 [Ceraceosorus guamensis]PWN42984.1 hypothetical protein IE81DRAFT_366164 [Ceraceosorus guamensis]
MSGYTDLASGSGSGRPLPSGSSAHSHSYSQSVSHHAPHTSVSGGSTLGVSGFGQGGGLYGLGAAASQQESMISGLSGAGHSEAGSNGLPVPQSQHNSSQLLIASIVQRLVNRLPYNSGWRLASLEEEQLVRSCVANLVDLSQYQLASVVKELLAVLENLNKSVQVAHDDKVSVDAMQSQLFMLQVLLACLVHHWRTQGGPEDPTQSESTSSATATSSSQSAHQRRGSLAPTDSRSAEIAGVAKGWNDPPPMEDGVAKHILSLMVMYLRQSVAKEEAIQTGTGGSDHLEGPRSKSDGGLRAGQSDRALRDAQRGYISSTQSGKGIGSWEEQDGKDRAGSAGSGLGSSAAAAGSLDSDWTSGSGSDVASLSVLGLFNGKGLFVLYPTFPPSRAPFQRSPHVHLYQNPQRRVVLQGQKADKDQDFFAWGDRSGESLDNAVALTKGIYRAAGQIVFYLSSSNWPVVFARYRNRVQYLSTTVEDSPNTAELRLLECSNMQRARLSNLIQELCTTFLHLKRTAQHTMALVVRRGVWSWIQYHPAEFAHLFGTGRRLEGGPELLFDHIVNLTESSRKKLIFWPVLTALLILCPDIVSKAAIGEGRKQGSVAKKVNFLETLRKSLRVSKLSDMAAICCVDIVRAASCTPLSDAGLRLIVPDLEADLREKLFDPSHPPLNNNRQIETSIIVEAFVAFFRLDPQKTLKTLVPVCLGSSSPQPFKLALIRSCIQMASERNRLPWTPDVSLLYPHISAQARTTAKDIIFKLHKTDAAATHATQSALIGSTTKTDKRSLRTLGASKSIPGAGVVDESQGRIDVLQAILKLWCLDIRAMSYGLDYTGSATLSAFVGPENVGDHEVISRAALSADSPLALIYFLGRIAHTTDHIHLHELALDLMDICSLGLYDPAIVAVDFMKTTQRALVSCTSLFTRGIADHLAQSESTADQRHWLSILSRTMKRKVNYISSLRASGVEPLTLPNIPTNSEFMSEGRAMEAALLLSICSSDTDVCSEALRCCGQIASLREIVVGLLGTSQEWAVLMRELSDPSFSQTGGRIAQQKRIRALLRGATLPTRASAQAWCEAYQRWGSLTQLVARPLADETSDAAQEKAAQWHNYAGFLAALGGTCVLPDEESLKTAPKETMIDPPVHLVESFMQEMVDLLVSDSVWVREKVKETLGLDLSPRLNGILFRQVHAVLSDFFDKSTGLPRPADMFTIFVEQSVSVTQMVLNRMTAGTEATNTVDIGSLMVLYVEYVNSLGRKEQAVRIKTSMCHLCEALMHKKSFFAFSNELRVRNRLFQALVTWTSDSSDEAQGTEKLDRLQRELDVVCLKTISILLDRLPLLLADDALLLDDKVEWAKSRQFSLYFNYFIKVLNRARTLEEAATERAKSGGVGVGAAGVSGGAISSSVSMALGVSAAKLREQHQQAMRELGPLKESAILALSNLLASNIDSGLQHSLPLAYNDDQQLRTAFMQIMTNVLNQGTAFDDLERLSASHKHSKLIELICEPDMQLALSVCNICKGNDVDNMDYVLLSIFDSRGGIIKFLKAALAEEIYRTPSEEMVFRSNSFRTHLLSVFGRTHGYEYLRSIMAPLITEMANKPRGYSFEIDPHRIEPGESVHINQHRLEEMAQTFIDQICSSAHRVPAVLRELCRHIRSLMDARFPTSRYQGVGGFMFLRFISPVVVAPQIIDINLTGPSKELRRGLLLISKILQTLASNNLFPPHKEPFMTCLNDFLKGNVWRVATFLDQVSDARTDPDRLQAADQPLGYGIHPYGYGIDQEDQRVIHRFLFENVDKVGKELLTRNADRQSSLANDSNGAPMSPVAASHAAIGISASTVDSRRTYEQLCQVLAEMGDYRSEELPAIAVQPGLGASKQAFQDFLRRNSGRNVDDSAYKAVFREGPPSKAGRPVFYYNAAQQNAKTMDYEGLIFYVLQCIESCVSRNFDLVLDCTGLHPVNMTPHQWLTYFATMVPPEVAGNMRNVIVFNANTTARLYARPWYAQAGDPGVQVGPSGRAALASVPSQMSIAYCNSIAEIEAFIERRNLALDPTTIAIATSAAEMRFTQITMVWYYRSLIPVSFRIGGEHLQITALKPQEIVPGRSGFTNDVFHLADIDDVRAISARGDDTTFFVTCRGGTISFLFNSRDRAEIVQSLRQAKARISRFRPSKALDRTLLPSDVPGTLLNMAMLNVTSGDASLRVSAYNLLCALSTSFNFGASNARRRLLSAKGLAIPANTLSFVSELSRDFAVAAPGVTLEFLLSFFEGFERATLSQKTLCLYYMAPWLSNLVMFTHTAREQQGEYQKRIKEILSQLIAITVKQPEMYSAMQRAVWSQISRLDDLIPLFVEVFCEAAMDSGLHTPRFECVLDTMVSFSSINLRGKLLARLRRVIAKTAQNPTAGALHDNIAWKEIATLVRMNMVLSFTSRLEGLIYLPELLHVILLLAGNGVDATRHSFYGTAVNLIHSLCTEDQRDIKREPQTLAGLPTSSSSPHDLQGAAMKEPPANIAADNSNKLRALLTRFAEDEYLALFGLPAGSVSPLNASIDVVRDMPSNAAIERLASVMYEVAELAAPTTDTANSWRARLTSLVTSTAFQYNPIIQSRAFLLLGCLADLTRSMMTDKGATTGNLNGQVEKSVTRKSGSREADMAFEVDDDLLYQILVSLRGSITEWANASNDAPIISIVTCLSKVVKILPDRSRYLPQLFWLGISMIQYGHVPLFKAGTELLLATVTSIWDRNLLQEGQIDLITFLIDGRYEFRDAACRLDDETGVDFEINFSFAAAALLVKGLRHPSTKSATTELLRALLQYTGFDSSHASRSPDGRISVPQLGFFIGLLPTATRPEDFGELLSLAGAAQGVCTAAIEARKQGGEASGLFKHLDATENKVALLIVTLIAALLQHAENDAERLLLYGFLADSAQEVPAIVSILYDSLAPGMRDVFVNSQNGPILDAVHTIARIAVSEPVFAAQALETTRRGGPGAYLDETGYASLLDCGDFAPLPDVRRLTLAKLSTALLAGLIDAGTA